MPFNPGSVAGASRRFSKGAHQRIIMGQWLELPTCPQPSTMTFKEPSSKYLLFLF